MIRFYLKMLSLYHLVWLMAAPLPAVAIHLEPHAPVLALPSANL